LTALELKLLGYFTNLLGHRKADMHRRKHITSKRSSRKKWVKEPADIKKKHCILVRGTCNPKLKK